MICSLGTSVLGVFTSCHYFHCWLFFSVLRSKSCLWKFFTKVLEANLACVNQFVDRSSSRYVEHDHRRSSNIHLSIFASTWWLTVPALVDWSKYSFVQCSSQIELYHISLRAQAGETEEWIPDHPANPLSGLFPQINDFQNFNADPYLSADDGSNACQSGCTLVAADVGAPRHKN